MKRSEMRILFVVAVLTSSLAGLIGWQVGQARDAQLRELRDQVRLLQFELVRTGESCHLDYQTLAGELNAEVRFCQSESVAMLADLTSCRAAQLPAVAIADAGTALRLADGYLFTAIRLLEPGAGGDNVLNSALVYLSEVHFHLSDANSWLGLPPLPTPSP